MLSNVYHRPWARRLRSVARKMGVLKLVRPLFIGRQKRYEAAFNEALRASIRPGDTVWDVGANVGLYTTQFLDWVGPDGVVVAFEPLPRAYEALAAAVEAAGCEARFIGVPMALSNEVGQARLVGNLDSEDVTTTGQLSVNSSVNSETQAGGLTIEMTTADVEAERRSLPLPQVVKIDVEGFEEEVLAGGTAVFGEAECRHLLIEMHFARIEARQIGDSAARIADMLEGWGFRLNWVDPSHLHASR